MNMQGLVLGLLVGVVACATTKNGKPVSEHLGEHAAGETLESSLEVLARPESQERIAGILSAPPIREALREVSASMVAGAFDGMMERGEGAMPQAMSRPGRVIGGMGRELEPEVTEQEQRFASELGPGFDDGWPAPRSRSQRLVSSVGDTMASGMASAIEDELGPSLAATIERELGPALAKVLERDILPAVGRGVQDEAVQQAIVSSTASIGVGVARGVERGTGEARPEGEDGEGALHDLGRMLTVGAIVASVAAALLVAALVVLIVMLARASRRQTQLFEESRRREQLLIELLQQRAESSMEHLIVMPGTA